MSFDSQKNWDEWNQAGGPNYPHNKVVQFCLRRYPRERRAGLRVLDLGCGTGANTWFLAREGFAVTATDISAQGIAATKARLARDGLIARLRTEPAEAIGDPPGSFDLILCIGVLEAVGPQSAPRVMAEARRVLAPGGGALFLFAAAGDYRIGAATCYNLYGYTEDEVHAMVSVFPSVLLDRYITTYDGGRLTQFDWLVTCGVSPA